jgi:hypothetical protein
MTTLICLTSNPQPRGGKKQKPPIPNWDERHNCLTRGSTHMTHHILMTRLSFWDNGFRRFRLSALFFSAALAEQLTGGFPLFATEREFHPSRTGTKKPKQQKPITPLYRCLMTPSR